MKKYDPALNEFEKEINFFCQKSELLGWKIPRSVIMVNDIYENALDSFNKSDEIEKKIRLKNYLLMIKHARILFENRNRNSKK